MTPRVDQAYRRRVRSWAFYDWANHGYITTTSSTFFPPFFIAIATPAFIAAGTEGAAALAEARDHASNVFALTVSIALLVSAVLAPIIGTFADITGARKRMLIVFTVMGCFFSSAMFGIEKGMWLNSLVLYGMAQFSMNISLGLSSSLLQHIAPPEDMNRVSSLGYAYGYVGGGVLLLFNTILYIFAKNFGITSTLAVHIAFLSAGIWWLLFSIPLVLVVPEPPATPLAGSRGDPVADTLVRIGHTLRDVRRYKELFKMLIAFWFYMEGIGAIILLATAFGAALGLKTATLIGTLLMTQFVAFPYALIFGRIPGKTFSRAPMFLAFLIWTAVSLPVIGVYALLTGRLTVPLTFAAIAISQALGAVFSIILGRRLFSGLADWLDTKRAIMMGLMIYVIVPVWGFFLKTQAEFFLLGWLVGTVQGGTQALSRSLYTRLTPKAKSGEFFGLYGLFEKFAGILGPLLYAVVGEMTGSPRASIISIALFFTVGIILLARVRVEDGARLAAAEESRIDLEHTAD
jgi:UMF1 family MFS transporter